MKYENIQEALALSKRREELKMFLTDWKGSVDLKYGGYECTLYDTASVFSVVQQELTDVEAKLKEIGVEL